MRRVQCKEHEGLRIRVYQVRKNTIFRIWYQNVQQNLLCLVPESTTCVMFRTYYSPESEMCYSSTDHAWVARCRLYHVHWSLSWIAASWAIVYMLIVGSCCQYFLAFQLCYSLPCDLKIPAFCAIVYHLHYCINLHDYCKSGPRFDYNSHCFSCIHSLWSVIIDEFDYIIYSHFINSIQL